jgi:drug/metabolite transporter (DMT)-like permease
MAHEAIMALSGTAAGVALAVGATVAFELSYVLQARHARYEHDGGAVDPGLIARLARRPGWLVAMGLSVAGFGLQVLALRHASLSVVQPVLALGLVILLVLGHRMLGDRAGPREVAGALAVIAGVTLVVVAGPARGVAAHPGRLAVACVVLAVLALAPHVLRSSSARLLIASAACADALAALSMNAVARDLTPFKPTAVAWAILAAGAGLVALTSEAGALQRATVGRVGPPVLAGSVAIPVLLAPLVFGDRWGATPLGGALVWGGLALVVLASAWLGSSTAVAQVRHPEAT